MNVLGPKAAIGLASWWVRLYTRGMPRVIADARRAEFESDLWECLHDDGRRDGSAARSMEILGRVVRGVPSDLAWCVEEWRAARRAPADDRRTATDVAAAESHGMTPTGLILFQAIATIAILGAVARVTGTLLRVGEFRATVPTDDRVGVMVLVAIYCVPPLTVLAACLVAVPLVLKAQRLVEARALALFLAFMALFWGTVFSFFYFLPSEPGNIAFGSHVGQGASAWTYTWYVLAIVAFLRFSVLFPQPLDANQLGAKSRFAPFQTLRRLSMEPAAVWAVGAALILVMAAPNVGGTWSPRTATPVDVTWTVWWITIGWRIVLGYVIVPLSMMVFGVLNLFLGLRTATGMDRRRSLWVFAGFAVALWMVLVAVTLLFIGDLPDAVSIWGVPLFLFAPLVIVTCLFVAVFYRGDIDPALVIKRSTVYGTLGVAFVVLFAVAESLVSDLLVDRLGLPDAAGGALLGGLAAAVVIPFRRRLTAWVDRVGPRSGVLEDMADSRTDEQADNGPLSHKAAPA